MILRPRLAVLVSAGALGAMTAACGTETTSPPAIASQPAPSSTSASTEIPSAVPPFIDHARWVTLSSGRSLEVFPTPSGRAADGVEDNVVAWREVLHAAPDAETPGMKAQFDCHWTFARLVAPNKTSWNLEPWRPVVSEQQMVTDRCNPGGPEV